MKEDVVSQEEISNIVDRFTTFKYDKYNQKVINLKNGKETDVDEFLEIQNLLDNNRVNYEFEKNFHIQIIRNR